LLEIHRRSALAAAQDEVARRDRFAAIYEAHYHRILGYAMRRVSREDAGDVASETFVVACVAGYSTIDAHNTVQIAGRGWRYYADAGTFKPIRLDLTTTTGTGMIMRFQTYE
jgi:hypothetical protein